MIYLFNNNEEMIRIIPDSAIKRMYQTQKLTDENYISDRLDVEIQALNDEELSELGYMAIDDIENPQRFHYYFIVKETTEHQLTSLTGVQSGIEELRKTPVYDMRPTNLSPKLIADRLLEGTNWQAGYTTDDVGTISTNFYYTDVFSALKKMCMAFGIEMQFFVEITTNRIGARYIEFRKRTGKSVGKRVVYGHNALKIVKEVEKTNTVTALIGRGKGVQVSESDEGNIGYGRKIGFKNVKWKTSSGAPVDKPLGQEFVEIPELTLQYGIKNSNGTIRPKIGFVEFQDEESETRLIDRTYNALLELSRPQVLLETSSVYLPDTGIGDTINVVRHDRDLRYQTRVFEITWDRLANQAVDMKLGDRLGESENKRISRISNQVSGSISTELGPTIDELVDRLTTADGKNTNWYTEYDPMENPETKGLVRVNDNWYQPDPEFEGEFILKQWNGEMWVEILRTSGNPELVRRIDEAMAEAEQAKKDAAKAYDDAVAEADRLVAEQDEVWQGKMNDYDEQVALIDASARDAQAKADQALQDVGISTDLAQTAKDLATTAKSNASTALSNASQAISDSSSALSRAQALGGQFSDLSFDVDELSGKIDLRLTSAEVDSLVDGKGFATQTWANNQITASANGIRADITKVEGKIDGLEIGGRNLILDSGTPVESSAYRVAEYFTSEDFVEGQEYTVTIKGTKSSAVNFGLWQNSDSHGRGNFKHVKDDLYQLTFTSVATTAGNERRIRIYQPPSGSGGKATIEWIKLGKGNVATDWSPAPEDSMNYTNTQIDIKAGQVEQLITDVKTDPTGTITGYNSLKNNVDSMVQAIGSDGGKIAQMVMTDSVYQTTISNLDISSRIATGLNLSSDPMFEKGMANFSVYDNSGSGNITLTRTNATGGSQPTGKNTRLQITVKGAGAPGFGGVYRSGLMARANAEFVIKFIGHLPKGRQFSYHQNAMGSGFTHRWLTSNEGTGKWEEYAYYYKCGSSGDFSSFSYLAVFGGLTPTASNPFIWYIAKHEVYDISGSIQSQITQLSDSWALTLKSGNDIKTQINATTDGIRLQSKLIHLNGSSLIDNATIKSAHIDTLNANKIVGNTADFNTIRTGVLTADAVTATHIKAENALIDTIFGTTALIKRLTSKTAFINSIKAMEIDAGKITTGELNAANVRIVNLDVNQLSGNAMNFISGAFTSNAGALTLSGSGMRVNFANGYNLRINGAGTNYYTSGGQVIGGLLTAIPSAGATHSLSLAARRGYTVSIDYQGSLSYNQSNRALSVDGTSGNITIERPIYESSGSAGLSFTRARMGNVGWGLLLASTKATGSGIFLADNGEVWIGISGGYKQFA